MNKSELMKMLAKEEAENTQSKDEFTAEEFISLVKSEAGITLSKRQARTRLENKVDQGILTKRLIFSGNRCIKLYTESKRKANR